MGCGLGRRLPQTGRPTGPGQGGSEGWRGGTQVGRFPGQGAKQSLCVSLCFPGQICVWLRVCVCIFPMCVQVYFCI